MDFSDFPLNHINLNKSDTKFFKIFNSLFSDFHDIKIEYSDDDLLYYKYNLLQKPGQIFIVMTIVPFPSICIA